MLASRIFDEKDQIAFAALSGDYNPMHVDPVAARRTPAGARVVHGVHSLVWLLDAIVTAHPELASVASLKARFTRMVYLGDRVEANVTQLKAGLLQATATVDGTLAVQLSVTFGPPRSSMKHDLLDLLPRPAAAQELSLEEMSVQSGRLAFATTPEESARMFPSAARLLGARRLAAICCSTLLVGMVVPGLHSIYSGLTLNMYEDDNLSNEIGFKVISVDPRFRLVRQEIWGSGLAGTIDCFARQPPVQQPSIAHVATLVSHDEFEGATALIVGGSRGLGELVAKIIAAGGGKAIVSYAVGKADADKLQAEIVSWGGKCEVVPYDVLDAAEAQLGRLTEAPTHCYYFATPTIYVKKSECFVQRRFEEFSRFYLSGFYDLVQAAVRRRPAGIDVFYPSSIFVEDRSPGMSEYAMVKAAGEILCAEINAHVQNARVVTARLPRMPTDQTASLIPEKTADPLDVLLPIIRNVQRT